MPQNVPNPVVRSTARALPALVAFLAEHVGATPHEPRYLGILRDAGVEVAQLQDPDFATPLSLHVAIWQEAARIEPWIGLTLAARILGQGRHLLGHLLQHTNTLREAIEAMCHFGGLATESDRWAMDWPPGATEVTVTFENHAAAQDPALDVRFFAELYFTQCMQFAAALSDQAVRPVRLELTHTLPVGPQHDTYLRVYEQIFHAPVQFGCAHNRIIFPATYLDLAVARADPKLGQLLMHQARKTIAARGDGAELTNTTTQPIPTLATQLTEAARPHLLSGAEPSMEQLAKRMGIVPERLRRDLRRAGLGIRSLRDTARRDALMRHLERGMSVKEIAYMMEFSEPAALQHACKRWFGVSVGELRRRDVTRELLAA